MIRALQAVGGPVAAAALRRTIAWAVAAGIAQGAAIAVVVPVIGALFAGEFSNAARWLSVLVILALAQSVLLSLATMDGVGSAMNVIDAMHERLGRQLIRLPLNWFDGAAAGRASHAAVRGTLFVANAAMDQLVPYVVNIVAPATVALAALAFDPWIGLAMIVCIPVFALTARLAESREDAAEDRLHELGMRTDTRLLEFSRNQVALRSAGRGGTSYRPLAEAIEEQRKAGMRAIAASVIGMSLQSVVVQTAFALIVVLACSLAVQHTPDTTHLAMLIALIGLTAQFTGPLRILASVRVALHKATTEIEEVRTLLDQPPLPEPDSPTPFPSATNVQLDRVTFGYDAQRPVLQDVTLDLPDRGLVAVVGPSGSGKTTLLRLIARLWDVESGAIRIGGVDVRDLHTSELYRRLSVIFQDVYLFDETLEANIALGDEQADRDRLREAAVDARVDEIAGRLPNGWQTPVGEGGMLLSGGERQRVSIARAVVRQAPIVLCDEPTSALDASSRNAVVAGLSRLARTSLVVVVAHDLTTIAGADRIVVLADGRVDAVGTHKELLSHGVYAAFWEQRIRSTGWALR